MSDNKHPTASAFVIIDMQNGYFTDPALSDQKRKLTDAINRYSVQFRAQNIPIINVRTVHAVDGSTWTKNMIEDDQGFMLPGVESEPVEGLDVTNAIDITKTRDDAFHRTKLLKVLRSLNITNLLIAGISTHSCIFQTASTAYAYDFDVTILSDAVGDEDDTLAAQAIDYLKKEYRVTCT